MVEVSFYHLTTRGLTDALGQLVFMARGRDMRVAIACGSVESLVQVSDSLWAYPRAEAFLAHCHSGDKLPDEQARVQKIWLTAADDFVNEPELLILCDGRSLDGLVVPSVTRVLDVFDGNDDEQLALARERYRLAKVAGHEVKYYAQNESGGWHQPRG
ncbi:MAG: DNA polymerase III subunit chi [Candidatus Pacebacteria bacterium]|nr:DNA polymerase III subunit chi [Candidatus Paceibacterota bacterium]